VSLSGGAAADVFTLAQALVAGGQHRRALELLRAESLEKVGALPRPWSQAATAVEAAPVRRRCRSTGAARCLHLAGQCLLAVGTPEEALALLGEEEDSTGCELRWSAA
jgi:hypothetical protein